MACPTQNSPFRKRRENYQANRFSMRVYLLWTFGTSIPHGLLSDAEGAEDQVEDVVVRSCAGHLIQRSQCVV